MTVGTRIAIRSRLQKHFTILTDGSRRTSAFRTRGDRSSGSANSGKETENEKTNYTFAAACCNPLCTTQRKLPRRGSENRKQETENEKTNHIFAAACCNPLCTKPDLFSLLSSLGSKKRRCTNRSRKSKKEPKKAAPKGQRKQEIK